MSLKLRNYWNSAVDFPIFTFYNNIEKKIEKNKK